MGTEAVRSGQAQMKKPPKVSSIGCKSNAKTETAARQRINGFFQ
jgi:hypothetical protein